MMRRNMVPGESSNTARPSGDLNIDQSAWMLIRRFGKDACHIAEIRALYCRNLDRHMSAAKWQCVHAKLLELTADEPVGSIH